MKTPSTSYKRPDFSTCYILARQPVLSISCTLPRVTKTNVPLQTSSLLISTFKGVYFTLEATTGVLNPGSTLLPRQSRNEAASRANRGKCRRTGTGFASAIETARRRRLCQWRSSVARGLASRLRLKRCQSACGCCCRAQRRTGTGFASAIETSRPPERIRQKGMSHGDWLRVCD